MGRESHSHDPTVVHSSIALLQERFRQLQRVKEMREEKELLRVLTSEPKHFVGNNSKPSMTTTCDLPPKTMSFSYRPELTLVPSTRTLPSPPPPHSHVSLSLWPSSSSSLPEPPRETLSAVTFLEPETPSASMTLWKNNTYDCDGSDSDSGVDTSLHL
ncbi:uncharacterized protein LOC129304762 [Prosopis cineraria]|uniref:uncharacterized protein LOC129304762 n=1 Tax=Prosopis cineraria TaxID=364024 RepID=UPI00240ED626|nr:uncharacterized protein LOC129304762 [Prosopis cineraria]